MRPNAFHHRAMWGFEVATVFWTAGIPRESCTAHSAGELSLEQHIRRCYPNLDWLFAGRGGVKHTGTIGGDFLPQRALLYALR